MKNLKITRTYIIGNAEVDIFSKKSLQKSSEVSELFKKTVSTLTGMNYKKMPKSTTTKEYVVDKVYYDYNLSCEIIVPTDNFDKKLIKKIKTANQNYKDTLQKYYDLRDEAKSEIAEMNKYLGSKDPEEKTHAQNIAKEISRIEKEARKIRKQLNKM